MSFTFLYSCECSDFDCQRCYLVSANSAFLKDLIEFPAELSKMCVNFDAREALDKFVLAIIVRAA